MLPKLRAVLVDDEPLALARLARLLGRAPDIEIVGECRDGRTAVAKVKELGPDILFLDIQMPEMSGFAVLEALGAEAVPALIFVTAFDEYAVRAFDAHAVDYLVKPFDEARLDRAVARARQQVAARTLSPLAPRLRALLAEVPRARPPSRLALPEGERTIFVNLTEIDYLEAEGNYVAVHVGNRNYLLRETLSALEARLDRDEFVRIHRSRIVRIDRVRAIEPWSHGEYHVILEGGAELTSARSYRDALRAALGLKSGDS